MIMELKSEYQLKDDICLLALKYTAIKKAW
jgi:hypothetical protein